MWESREFFSWCLSPTVQVILPTMGDDDLTNVFVEKIKLNCKKSLEFIKKALINI
jgi:hypothetical protein